MFKRLILATIIALSASGALAQWQVPSGAIPVGKGPGATGFNTVQGSSGTGAECLLDTSPPSFGACPGGTLAVGSTSITGGASGRFLYDNAGVLGEYAMPLPTAQGGTGVTTASFNFVTAAPYNAVCAGFADDSAAIQAAIDAMPASGGTINFPQGTCAFATPLDFKGKNKITLQGYGAMSSGGVATFLVYTGTGARALDYRETAGNSIDRVIIVSNNPAFSGILVDVGTLGFPGASAHFKITNSVLQPLGSAAPTCLNVNAANETVIDRVQFGGCNPAISGQTVLGQNTTVRILNSKFTGNVGAAIRECGDSWVIANNAFVADSLGNANAFSNTSTLPCRNLTFSGNWLGDVGVTGTFMTLTSRGANITGNRFANGAVSIALNGGGGYSIEGNHFDGLPAAITCINSPTGGSVMANYFEAVVTAVSATGCIGFNLHNNSPNISASYLVSTVLVGAAVPVTTNVQANVTSLVLPVGTWDVSAIAYLLPAATTSVTRYSAGISTSSAVIQTAPGQFVDFKTPALVTGGTTLNDVIPDYRMVIAAPTTIYLVTLNTFTVSTASVYGVLSARLVQN